MKKILKAIFECFLLALDDQNGNDELLRDCEDFVANKETYSVEAMEQIRERVLSEIDRGIVYIPSALHSSPFVILSFHTFDFSQSNALPWSNYYKDLNTQINLKKQA